jgi:ATP-dependent RNA helicase RhlE
MVSTLSNVPSLIEESLDQRSIMSFTQFGLSEPLIRALAALGYERPTPIQQEAIPAALAGRDQIGCAETGSGKTAAYLLPILQRQHASKLGPRTLILAPTRELAEQIGQHCQQLARFTPVRSAVIYGGAALGPQVQALRRGVTIVVATPGRLLDHLNRRTINLSSIEILVLDEADRMLDMGFLPDVRRIVSRLPKARQTMLFSATINTAVEQLAREMLDHPVKIQIGRRATPPAQLRQTAYPVPTSSKLTLLVTLLQAQQMKSALVFSQTRRGAEGLAADLRRRGYRAEALHAGRTQGQRQAALAGFRSGAFQVLVATDVAARGLDIAGVSHVINYDVPNYPHDYVHRIGRTARAGGSGQALTLVSPREHFAWQAIEQFIGQSVPRIVLPALAAKLPTYMIESPTATKPKIGRRSFRPRRR